MVKDINNKLIKNLINVSIFLLKKNNKITNEIYY